jgi:alpha-beta hydrolase superfamily lysophospholipase
MSGADTPMKMLFLHGWRSVPGGLKPSYLIQQGHEVINPALDDDDFDEAVRTAQAEYNRHRPDVIVGSSRGGAVAMNLDSGSTPLVLLCPAWKRWGPAKTLKRSTVVLHSEADDVIPIAHSRELVRASGLPESALLVVGTDHRLADPEPLRAMLEACERAATNRSSP